MKTVATIVLITISLCAGTPGAIAHDAANADKTLVVDGAVKMTASQLDSLVGNQLLALRAEEYATKRRLLDERIAELLLDREAQRRGLTRDQLIEIEVAKKVPAVTDGEIAAVLESSRERFDTQPEAVAKGQIRDTLSRQREATRRAELVRQLRADAKVTVLLQPPRAPVPPQAGPSKGPESARVTIVEYSDFQCPFCARSAAVLRAVAAKYGDRVRMQFRHFPLPMHRDAGRAAEASMCADDQGQFWPMHDRLFAGQKAGFSNDVLKQYASDVNLDRARFDSCLDSGVHTAAWRTSVAEAKQLGVSSTPTLFINGRFESGAIPLEPLSEIIDAELARDGPTPVDAQRGTPLR